MVRIPGSCSFLPFFFPSLFELKVLRLSLWSPYFLFPSVLCRLETSPQTCSWFVSPSPSSLQKGWCQKKKPEHHCLELPKQCEHSMLAQPGPYKLAIDLMNQLCAQIISSVWRGRIALVLEEKMWKSLYHICPTSLQLYLFSLKQDYWKAHTLYIMKMEEY